MPARSIDTATIAFGLVSIPVKVYSTSEPSEEIHFHMIHAGCGERVKQQYVCPEHGAVERSDIVKGFELSKNHIIELTKEELKALDAVASDEIAMAEFVPATAVDPLYIDRSYYLGPSKGGDRAYRLFRDALESSELVGIAAYAARGKQYVVMVRPYEDGLVMHQLRYPDEIKPWSEVPLGKMPKAQPAELGLAARIIEGLTHTKFDPSQYKDEVKVRVRKLIAQKAKTGAITVPEAPEEAASNEPVDLMAALKASLGGGTKRSGAHGKQAAPTRARTSHAAARKPAKRAAGHRAASGTRSARRAAA